MQKFQKTSNSISVLSISSKYIHDCNTVSLLLQKNGVFGQVRPNQTIEKQDNHIVINTGCKIVFTDRKPQQVVDEVWPKLKQTFFLDCAYFKTDQGYSGCINKYNKECNDKTSNDLS